jgi:hypothetical protein
MILRLKKPSWRSLEIRFWRLLFSTKLVSRIAVPEYAMFFFSVKSSINSQTLRKDTLSFSFWCRLKLMLRQFPWGLYTLLSISPWLSLSNLFLKYIWYIWIGIFHWPSVGFYVFEITCLPTIETPSLHSRLRFCSVNSVSVERSCRLDI